MAIDPAPTPQSDGASKLEAHEVFPRILYVEDNDTAFLVAEAMLSESFNITRASSAEAFVDLISREDFDLILMDIELQGSQLNGIELTRLIRGRLEEVPRFAIHVQRLSTPLIFVTSHSATYTPEALREHGADAVLNKPVNPDELSSYVRSMLSVHRHATHEAQERQLQTETDLRLEMELKLKLFANASHHLNNPLNHIQGSLERGTAALATLTQVVAGILPSGDSVIESERKIVDDFRNQVSALLDTIAVSHQHSQKAIKRTSEVVTSLRALSGIDGISYEFETLESIIDAAVARLTISTNWKADLGPKTRVHFDQSCQENAHTAVIGSTALYAMAIEWTIDSTLGELDPRDTVIIGFMPAEENPDHHTLTIETTASDNALPRLTHIEKARIAHILKPYRCQIEELHDAWHLSLCAQHHRAAS